MCLRIPHLACMGALSLCRTVAQDCSMHCGFTQRQGNELPRDDLLCIVPEMYSAKATFSKHALAAIPSRLDHMNLAVASNLINLRCVHEAR